MGYARHVGRVGALAVALGVGAAVLANPGIALADTDGGSSDSSSQDSSSSTKSSPGADAARTGSAASAGTAGSAGVTKVGSDAGKSDGDDGDGSAAGDGGVDLDDGDADIDLDGDDLGGAGGDGDAGTSGSDDDEPGIDIDAATDDSGDTPGRHRKLDNDTDDSAGASTTSALSSLSTLSTASALDGGDPITAAPTAFADAITDQVAPLAQVADAAVTSLAAAFADLTPTVDELPVLPQAPAEVDGIVAQVLETVLSPLSLVGEEGGDGGAGALALAVLGFVRRETEGNVALAAANPADAVSTSLAELTADPITWFMQTFFAASPVLTDPAPTVVLVPGETSVPQAFGGTSPDGRPLTYTVASTSGSAGGTIIVDGAHYTYKPPADWNGTDPINDVFVVTASDEGDGFHIHGFEGLLNLVTFGLVGNSGHTATSNLTVKLRNESPIEQGSFPITVNNNTGGNIYVFIVGQPTNNGSYSYVDKNGDVQAMVPTVSGPGTTSMGILVPPGEALLRYPPELQGGRIYVSKEQPLTVLVNQDPKTGNIGYSVYDPANPTGNPNYDISYDFYEWAYRYQDAPGGRPPVSFGGDPSYVDHFASAILMRLQQTAPPGTTPHDTVGGVDSTTDAMLAGYKANVSDPWEGLIVMDGDRFVRVLSPRSAQPGALSTIMDPAVTEFLTKYDTTDPAQQFSWDGPGYNITNGHTVMVDGKQAFSYVLTSDAPGSTPQTFVMAKPTSAQIFAADGPFVYAVPPNTPNQNGNFLANLNGAFNRGVATSPEDWNDPTKYYQTDPENPTRPYNEYAKYLHSISENNLIYAFPYDDTNNQSGVQILDNAQPPTMLTITIA